MDTDATQNLKPEDAQQDAPKGTRIGKLSREKVFADFRRIAGVTKPSRP